MSPRALTRWLAVVGSLFAILLLYIEIRHGPSLYRRVILAVAAVVTVGSAWLSTRLDGSLKRATGHRLWRSGPLGRAWLERRGGQ